LPPSLQWGGKPPQWGELEPVALPLVRIKVKVRVSIMVSVSIRTSWEVNFSLL